MDSIEKGATIRMGLRTLRDSLINDCTEYVDIGYVETYALKINKKTIFKSEGKPSYFGETSLKTKEDVINFYKEQAEISAKYIKENNIKNYVIWDGETLTRDNKWKTCSQAPIDCQITVRETLEKLLN